MLHQRYLELAKRVVSQLQQFDGKRYSWERVEHLNFEAIRQPWYASRASAGRAQWSEWAQ